MTDYAELIERTRALLAERRVAEAEQFLLHELAGDNRNPQLLELTAEFYLEVRLDNQAAALLSRLIEVAPQRSSAYFRLAETLDRLDRIADIVDLFDRLCEVHEGLAEAHFNRATYLRRVGRLDEAIEAYRAALDLKIDEPAEAYNNIGVILLELERQSDARQAFAEALALDERWTPAIYNRALLDAKSGARDEAIAGFERVRMLDPDNHAALARLVHAQRIDRAEHPLVDELRASLARQGLASVAQESLGFALAKALDDCGEYDDALKALHAANALARARCRPFVRQHLDARYHATREAFDARWLARAPVVSQRPLVFVCGPFRSGVTLMAQMLGANAGSMGGEFAYFNTRLDPAGSGFPHGTSQRSDEELLALGQGYLDFLDARFTRDCLVVNRRPDVLPYLGLLRGLFPRARFVVMRRNTLDMTVSTYFEQLADGFGYTTDLEEIAHHLVRLRALMRHWRSLFPDSILEVSYENLVRQPEAEVRRACEFLDLPWDSVSQTDYPLHERSIERWKHYAEALEPVRHVLAEDPDGI